MDIVFSLLVPMLPVDKTTKYQYGRAILIKDSFNIKIASVEAAEINVSN